MSIQREDQATAFLRRKERKKVIRIILECAGIALLVYILVMTLINTPVYMPERRSEINEAALFAGDFATGGQVGTKGDVPQDTGFIAISYFGVEKYGAQNSTLIDVGNLDEQIKALKASGYVTISQQEVFDYLRNGTPLPERALFLMFEDGRRDTAIFTQPILEKNNCQATILTYCDRLEKTDNKFLSPTDLRELLDSGFWEMGTNGYRLEFINVFDRYQNFYGHLTANEFNTVSEFLGRDYNHYLMDFIRDKDGIPQESSAEMRQRITEDYSLMAYNYTKKMGQMPGLYVLMHSNTGKFGTHDWVSAQNAELIPQYFQGNFNREGSCFNAQGTSNVYDMQRMQPQAHWSVNHLLMRIWAETGLNMAFQDGETVKKNRWNTLDGWSMFEEDSITLTSMPNAPGRMVLKDTSYTDASITTILKGNIVGRQGLFLRADENLQNYTVVRLENDILTVCEAQNGTESELACVDLFELRGGAERSVEEDERLAQIELYGSLRRFSTSNTEKIAAANKKAELERTTAPTVEQGGEPFIPEYDLLDRGEYALRIDLIGDTLSVTVDGLPAVEALPITNTQAGSIGLEAAPLSVTYSQRNLADTVYDAVFNELYVFNEDAEGLKTPIYKNSYSVLENIWLWCKKSFVDLVKWFVKTL